MLLLILWTCLSMNVAPSEGMFKRWIRNVNYDNPGNWNVGRLPCEKDNVTIPESSPVVYLQHDTALLELILPMNGELVLTDTMTLNFGMTTPLPTVGSIRDRNKTAVDVGVCRGSAVTFNRSAPANWFDPENWCTADTEDGPCQDSSVVDTDRLPCTFDDVVFPKMATYLVDMDTSDDITVGRLKLRGKMYTEPAWDVYIRTGGGNKEFVRTRGTKLPNLKIRGEICDDVTGCLCGNDETKTMHKICAIQKHRCPPLRCEKPLQPRGSCCRLCGAQLNMEYGVGFSIDHVRQLITQQLIPANESLYTGVKFSLSKVSPGNVQVIFTDSGDGSASLYLATRFNDVVMDDIEHSHLYSVETVTMRKSEVPIKTDQIKGDGLPFDWTIIVAISVSAFVVIVILVLLSIYIYKRRRSDFFRFSRFFGSGKARDIELITPSVSYVDVLGSAEVDVSRGFDNPLYGSSPLGKVFPLDDAMDFYQDPSVKFNPAFSADGIDQDSTI